MGIENNTTIDIPDYLNVEFLEQVLKNELNHKDFQINNWDVAMATKTGDNYCSEMYRVIISYGTGKSKQNKLTIVVKCMPYSEHRGVILDDLHVYHKEADMFTRVLPIMKQICHGEFFNAKCYYTVDKPVPMIAFQDLSTLGFKMADRKIGLDYEHCSLVLKKLGIFHATSMIMATKDPTLKDKYSFGMYHKAINVTELFTTFIGGNFTSLREAVETWPRYETIAEKLKKLEVGFMEMMYDCVKRDNDSYCVLNHGDLWVNNILFKYDNETTKPIDVVFVDYQMNYYASPGLDLNYFIHTSPNNEVRDDQRDDMIQEYYKSFVSTLKELEYKNIPSYETLLKEIKRKEIYGMAASIMILPVVLMEKQAEEGSGIEGMLDEDISKKMRKIMFNGVKYQKSMKSILKRFDSMNLLG